MKKEYNFSKMKEVKIQKKFTTKLRKYNAEYYNAFKRCKDDILFYEQFISDNVSVLELGCGTGRVTFPLAEKAKQVIGVDISKEMISKAKKQAKRENIKFLLGDMTSLNLNIKFDLVIAPFRVLQALETENEVLKSLETIKKHLSPKGLGILSIFNPYLSKDDMKTKWIQGNETECGETVLKNGDVLKHSEIKKHLDAEKQVFYVDLIYRRYRNNKLVDEHINQFACDTIIPMNLKILSPKMDSTLKTVGVDIMKRLMLKGLS